MLVNAAAENVLGTLGAVCWTVQLVPQVWKSWRTKSTKGLSPWFLFIWGIAAAFLGVYALVKNLNVPLILQPQLFGCLSLISWGQCHYYRRKQSQNTIIIMVILVLVVVGALETGMVFAIRPSYNHGNDVPIKSFGIISSILLAVALVPQYVEIYKYQEVIGISITFMIIDLLGGVFSDLSLAFKSEFDVIASISYTLVVVLDGVVIIAAIILNPRARHRRQHLMDLNAASDAASTIGGACNTTTCAERTVLPSLVVSHMHFRGSQLEDIPLPQVVQRITDAGMSSSREEVDERKLAPKREEKA